MHRLELSFFEEIRQYASAQEEEKLIQWIHIAMPLVAERSVCVYRLECEKMVCECGE